MSPSKRRIEIARKTAIDAIDEIIGDKSIPWDECCDALEDIEDHAGEWARQIRSEHE